ncbi:MAG TPA: hypothetical protein VJ840_07360 [Gemmatimonadaceae bacterium]|nr:hypothetical protein [Gemmatimonadaceae bacterium]
MIRVLLPMHIVAGLVSLASGFVALYTRKGARVHRVSGIVFVYAMLVMAACGATMAVMRSQPANIAGGTITLYLVTTGLLTLRARDDTSRAIDAATMLVAFAISVFSLTVAINAVNSPTGRINGVPPHPMFVFAIVAFLAALGDGRTMIVGGLRGARRIARHLWRMCFAMFVATGSFFLGQAKVFPKPIRIIPLLAAPVLLVIVTMLYWMVRVPFTKWYRRRAIDSMKPLELHPTA